MSRQQQSEGKRFGNKILPLLLLVLVTLAAYMNAWPDNLTLDDKLIEVSGYFSGLSLFGALRFFTEDLWAVLGGNSGLYRPLLMVTIAMDAYIYGDWVAGYHLSNILLHLLVTLLVYGFIRHLLLVSGGQSPLSDQIALLAAMVFGVHPVHTEVVNSIFNRSGLLISLGVIGGLWWFLRTLGSSPLKAWGGLALVYLLVLFCKESSVILPALAVAMLWIFTPGNWRVHLRKSLPVLWLVIPLGIFLGMRSYALDVSALPDARDVPSFTGALDAPALPDALDVPGAPDRAGTTETIQITSVLDSRSYFDWERLLSMVESNLNVRWHRLPRATRVWFESLRIIVWPYPLQIYHSKSTISKWITLVLQLILVIAAIVRFRQKRYGLIAGLAFFYIAMLPTSRIIGAGGGSPNLAERYVYLPSVGLAIALAFGLQWLTQRFNLRTVMAAIFIALVLLTPITLARNAQWASDVLLYESDYRLGNQKGQILHFLVGAHLRQKNYYRAVKICDKHVDQPKKRAKFSDRCSVAYYKVGRFDAAEHALLFALKDPVMEASIHQKLATMYLHLGRRSDAQKQFELAIDTEENPAFQEVRKSYMLMKLYPSDRAKLLEAKTHLQQALQLQPQMVSAHQLLELLNQVLGEFRPVE